MNCLRTVACFSIACLVLVEAGLSQSSTGTAASPELVGQLTQGLSITPQQATGGAGALFGLAKSRLSPADFSKIAAAVPGMGTFLKAAPKTGNTSGLPSLAGSLPGGMGGLAMTAEAFNNLGLSPSMAEQFVPVPRKPRPS